MGLVDYSDSETSDVEVAPGVKTTALPKPKSTFSKVVDRSHPGKIKVSLPAATLSSDTNRDEPPTKRVKTSGGGTFGGFNSFLPAPKRSVQTTSTTLGAGHNKNIAVGSKISFKTGSAPAFDRGADVLDVHASNQNSTSQESDFAIAANVDETIKQAAEEVKLVGKPLMFRPLSVSRKPAKKNISLQKPAKEVVVPLATTPQVRDAVPKPKGSLFSMSGEPEGITPSITSARGNYQPFLYSDTNDADVFADIHDTNSSQDTPDFQASYEDTTPNISQLSIPPAAPTPPVSQSLSDIAGDLNLSAAERRQLFGRQKGSSRNKQSATKIINFNTDQEYLHNEELRASGEQVKHNPVRAIAPGKHSLKQLVSAAQSQKDALEESFAKGKSNRAEASSRYGW